MIIAGMELFFGIILGIVILNILGVLLSIPIVFIQYINSLPDPKKISKKSVNSVDPKIITLEDVFKPSMFDHRES